MYLREPKTLCRRQLMPTLCTLAIECLRAYSDFSRNSFPFAFDWQAPIIRRDPRVETISDGAQ